MTTTEAIEKKLHDELETDVVSVKDLSDGCGAKYEILVASNKFQGMSILKRHKLIHQVCQDELKFAHAITLHTYSLEEYNKSVELQLPKKNVLDEMQEIDYMTFDKKRRAYIDASKYSKREAMVQYYEVMEDLNVGWSKKDYELFVKPVIRPSTLAQSVTKQNTPLENFVTAVRAGNTKEVLRIAEQEPDLLRKTDETGGTALHWAADADQDKMIELLISLRFFVDAQDDQGQTPIHIAAYCENLKAIRELLRSGVSLHVKDHDGETPMEVFNEDPNLLRFLDLYEFYPISA